MMLPTRLKIVTLVLVTFALVSTTAAGVAYHDGGWEPGGDTPSQKTKTDQKKGQQIGNIDLSSLQNLIRQLQEQNTALKQQLAVAEAKLAAAITQKSDQKSDEGKSDAPIKVPSISWYELKHTAGKNMDPLIKMIMNTVEPTSWRDHGGIGWIGYMADVNSIVVSNFPEVQETVKVVLTKFEATQEAQNALGKTFSTRKIYPVADLAGKEGTRLVDAITHLIEPDSWFASSSMSGWIEYFPEAKCLIVRHSDAVHTRVAELLTDLRKAKAEQEKKAP